MRFDDEKSLDSRSGATLHLYRTKAEGEARGIVLVFHGLAEHAGRYGRFARELARQGFHVFAHDHRGHGSTVAPDAPLRRFAGSGGSEKLLRDCRAVHLHALELVGELPVVVFGHSLGGHIALNYGERFGRDLAGLCVWNADFAHGFDRRLGRWALKAEKALKGSDVASELARRFTFGAWEKSVSPRRTAFDWLSHDEREIDAYMRDPLCGFTPTVSMMEDIARLVFEAGSKPGLSLLPPELPIHLLGGSQDPATRNGAAITELAEAMQALDCHDVESHVIPGARHETLMEAEDYRKPAMASLLAFLDRVTD
ncbi:alpha/beta hydrolase [Aurantimonas sp. 22II-16-19i]|uniref:alpha/beta fold hydrolase n=1 Tax=Aurantimonas sp. 22II-16-19i TaxID=1317114 RepID=UPI0009F801DE|nr:alpha/beta hydrolase [Aurantimonas sp. 22II-16-19i]ORE89705.1 lysophospholipase [Aurantimonas sp. 22II-16-19i]